MGMLGVQAITLEQHGAVSQETVLEMARGARSAFGVELAVSISGIAGPGGGTPEKPVGTVWIGLSTPEGEYARHFLWQGDRLAVKEQTAQAALNLLLAYLQGDNT
jgi:PncC family amidohydrolase